MIIETLLSIIWIIPFVLAHELGHVWLAKRQGIFVGLHFLPTPHVTMKTGFKYRMDYLSGIVASYLAYPLFHVTIGYMFSLSNSFILFSMMALIVGSSDFTSFLYFNDFITVDKKSYMEYIDYKNKMEKM